MSKETDRAACLILLQHLKAIEPYIESLDVHEGIIEEQFAFQAMREARLFVSESDAMSIHKRLHNARVAVGDACYLLAEKLEPTTHREALIKSYEAVHDQALQEESVAQLPVRVISKDDVKELVNYFIKAAELLKYPSIELGLDPSILHTTSGFVL